MDEAQLEIGDLVLDHFAITEEYLLPLGLVPLEAVASHHI